jgi:hypothetical protein
MRYEYRTMQNDDWFDFRWLAWWLKLPNFITIIDMMEKHVSVLY